MPVGNEAGEFCCGDVDAGPEFVIGVAGLFVGRLSVSR